MKLKIILMFTLSLVAESSFSQQSLQILSSSITFQIKNAGLTLDRSFTGIEGSIFFSPDALTTSKITASVDTKSIETGIGSRNSHLNKKEYLDTENYPTIHIVSEEFSKVEENKFKGKFLLTIKKTTKKIEIPFVYDVVNGMPGFEGDFVVNRLDYGIGGESWILSDKLRVFIKVRVGPINND
jgi:polyisoprenoid-binding protein YceI